MFFSIFIPEIHLIQTVFFRIILIIWLNENLEQKQIFTKFIEFNMECLSAFSK